MEKNPWPLPSFSLCLALAPLYVVASNLFSLALQFPVPICMFAALPISDHSEY